MQSNAARAGLLTALVAVAVVLFIVLSDDDESGSGSDATTSQPAAAAPTATEPAEQVPAAFEIQLRDGAPVGGVGEFEVTKGDRVRIVIRSDEDAELHVHGYELEDEVVAGGVARFSFPADIDGKFDVEAHSHSTGDIPLAELTVQPG